MIKLLICRVNFWDGLAPPARLRTLAGTLYTPSREEP